MQLYMCSAEQLPEIEAQSCDEADREAFQQSFQWSETSVPERIALLVGQTEDCNVPVRYLPLGNLVDL
jgi:hypothetical protein